MQLHCQQRASIKVGKLGSLRFEPGYYLYVGSAFGPGGVRARLKHHCAISARPHWHLDYLRPHAEIINAWYVADQRLEHHWAQLLQSFSQLDIPMSAFGSSDCACESHLFMSNTAVSTERMQNYLGGGLVSLNCIELLA